MKVVHALAEISAASQKEPSFTLTRAEAKELFECYWLNLSQMIRGIVSSSTAKFFEAYAHFETVTITLSPKRLIRPLFIVNSITAPRLMEAQPVL